MHYYNGLSAAKRIGISYKTLLRYVEKGRIVPEHGKTPTGQLVISENQVERLRMEIQHERDMFTRPQSDTPISRHHETPTYTQELPLTDTTLTETVKLVGKLQGRVDVQQARIEELERRLNELETKSSPVIAESVEKPSASPLSTQQTTPTIPDPHIASTIAKSTIPVPADLPPGTLHSSDFAEHLGLKRTVFDSMMKNGVGGEELERTKIPILTRPGKNTNYFTPEQQHKAIELLRRHGKIR